MIYALITSAQYVVTKKQAFQTIFAHRFMHNIKSEGTEKDFDADEL